MTTLQHHTLDTLIKAGHTYDGNNVVIENVIFEVDQLKERIEKEIEDLHEDFKFTQKIKNSKVQNFSNKFWKLTAEISSELFDDFSYSGVTTTDGEVEWKEYFHTVYDAVVPDDTQVYIHQVWDVLPEPPCKLDINNRCWSLVRRIQNKFDQLKIEGGKVDTLTHILNYQTNLGKEMISLKKEITEKSKTLSLYYRILDWSMH